MLLLCIVVHVKDSEFDTYIGRSMPPNYIDVGFGNPFKLEKDYERNIVLLKYVKYLRENPDIIFRAENELKGKILGCWCRKPHICHGDILAAIANEGVSGLDKMEKKIKELEDEKDLFA